MDNEQQGVATSRNNNTTKGKKTKSKLTNYKPCTTKQKTK